MSKSQVAASLAASIFAVSVDKTLHKVHIAQADIDLYVREFDMQEYENYSRKVHVDAQEGMSNATAYAAIALDADGNRVFSDDDILKIAALPTSMVLPVIEKFRAINNDTADSVGDAEKN